MKTIFLAAVAALVLAPAAAFAGNSSSTSGAIAGVESTNINGISNVISMKQKYQAGTPGSYGGGASRCGKYFAVGFPAGSLAFGDVCQEEKTSIGAGTAQNLFGTKGARDYVCDNDSAYRSMDYCQDRRARRSGAKQRYDRAKYAGN